MSRSGMPESHQHLIHQVELGAAENFIYFVGDPSTHQMAIVDPAWDVPFIQEEAARLGYEITAIWLTHGHHDHTNGVAELQAAHDLPVYISSQEAAQLRPDVPQLHDVADGDKLKVGNLPFTVIHTPGHSPGGQCFYVEGHLIAGDTLFIDGCGRCDLTGSNVEAMYHSIHQKLICLPDSTIIYPGHNYGPAPTDTLGNQKQTNRFLRATEKADFIRERMG